MKEKLLINEINRIGQNAIQFIHKEHHYITQAQKYVTLWLQS